MHYSQVFRTTVSGTDSKKVYNCSGAKAFALGSGFVFMDKSDLVVVRIAADGTETVLTLTTDYTVSGGSGSTGTVTTVATYTDGQLVIYRDTSAIQSYDAEVGDGFDTDTFERQLDRMTMVIQEQTRRTEAAIRFADSSTLDGDAALPNPSPGKALVWNQAGNGFTNGGSTVGSGSLSVLADYAELRAVDSRFLETGDTSVIGGRSATGDGGGGTFIWDASDLSAEVAADTQSGIYVAPGSDATGASGAWVRQYDKITPQMFGAKGDWNGTTGTDDATAFSAAISYGPVYLGNKRYKLSSGISIDLATSRLIGDGAEVYFDVSGNETLLTISNSHSDVNTRGLRALVTKGVKYTGAGKSVGTVRFAVVNDSVNNSIWGCAFEDGGCSGFNRGIEAVNGAFALSTDRFHFISNGTCLNISTGTNSGERNTFINSFFTNSDVILTQSNPNASTQFIGCSIDYTPRMMTITGGGDVYITSSHIESNLDTDTWFSVSGSNSTLRITQSTIALNNTDADLVNAPFTSQSSVTMGGIYIDSCQLWTNATYTTDVLIAGAGASRVTNLTVFENGKKPALSRRDTFMAYGDYESANYTAEYTLSGTTPPVRTNTKAYTGTYSLQFEMGSGATASRAVVQKPISPGQMPIGHFYYQTDIATYSATFLVAIKYLDAGGNTISSQNRLVQAADVSTWTIHEFAPQFRAPAGATHFQLSVEVFGSAGGTSYAWIDDLVISVI